MCICSDANISLEEGAHLYIDTNTYNFVYATSPEEAEYKLRHWASHWLRNASTFFSRSTMAGLLSRRLNMIAKCEMEDTIKN